MAVDKINSSGGVNGRPIELVLKDSLNDTEIAKKIAADFLLEDVKLVVGDFTSNLTKSALEIIDGKDILYLSPTSSSDFFNDKDDNLLRFTGSSDNMVSAVLEQMEAENDENIIIIKDHNNLAFVDSFSEVMERKLENDGGSIIEQVYFDGNQVIEISSIINKLDEFEGDYDGILLLANASSTVSIVQAIKTNGLNANVYTSSWSNTSDLLTLGGGYIDGIYTIGAVDAGSNNVKYVDFSDKYINYYGSKPSISAVFAYDTMMALHKGLLVSKSENPKKVKKSIIEIGIIEGLQNSFEIDEYGDSSRNFVQFMIKYGKIVRIHPTENE